MIRSIAPMVLGVSVENLEFHVMISRSRSPLVSTVASEPIPAKNRERSRGLRGALGRKDGYDRKSLLRRNWLYKIGSAPGSYSCLLRMQTSSPNARKPHESALRVFSARPQREDRFHWYTAVLSIPTEISSRLFARPGRDPRIHCPSSRRDRRTSRNLEILEE